MAKDPYVPQAGTNKKRAGWDGPDTEGLTRRVIGGTRETRDGNKLGRADVKTQKNKQPHNREATGE